MLQRPPARGILITDGVKKSMLSEEVYNQLKEMIVSRKFKKGQRLVEEKLAHRVNVSRNPMGIEVLDPQPWQREKSNFLHIKDIYTKRKIFAYHLHKNQVGF